jgi:hypothetical protein
VSYPPNTNGFLYYYMSPDKPPIAGELRLRVTSSDGPASFGSGSDLLRSDGRLWSRPLLTLSKDYSLLYKKLREEAFVSDDLDAALSFFPIRSSFRSQLLYTLNDTFIVDFSINEEEVIVVTEQAAERLPFMGICFDSREGMGTPYAGAYINHHLLY